MSSDPKILGFQILFEDAQCLFINKPSGMLTQAPPGIDSIERRIKSYFQSTDSYLGVPHRLDRAASGVMVFAKTHKAARRLAEQFQGKTVEKTYWALVEGKVREQEGTWIDSMHKVNNEPRAELIPSDHPEAKNREFSTSSIVARQRISPGWRVRTPQRDETRPDPIASG